jgi:hypothetical protein
MAFAGSSPRWREAEARLRPVVRPVLQLVPPRKPPDKLALCERFCRNRRHFLEIKLHMARLRINGLVVVHPDIPAPKHWTAREIIYRVAEKHGLSVNDILCSDRRDIIVQARHEVCYEMARLTPLSLPQMGKALGGRDHTTVLNGIKRHQERTGEPPVRKILPPARPEGYQPKHSKWLPERLIQLCQWRDEGLMQGQIAKRLGISLHAVKWGYRMAAVRGMRAPKSTQAD